MAAEKGNIYSQNNLGHLYSYGLGIPKQYLRICGIRSHL